MSLPGGKPGSNGGKNLHDSTTRVREMILKRKAGAGAAAPIPQPAPKPKPTPQPQPQTQPQPSKPKTRSEAQAEAAKLKQQRKKEREAKQAEKVKANMGKDLDAAIAKTKKKTKPEKTEESGGGRLSPAEVRKKEKLEASGQAQKIMDKRQDDAKLNPIGPEVKAIRTYTTDRDVRGVNQYQNLNNCLRNPGACQNAEEAKKLQEGLDNALKALPKNTDNFEFTRVIPINQYTTQLYDFLKSAKPGTVLEDKGYGSFTSDKSHAAGLAKPYFGQKHIQLVTRSGQIVPLNRYSAIQDEAEGLLPRNAKLKIAKVEETENGLTAYLED